MAGPTDPWAEVEQRLKGRAQSASQPPPPPADTSATWRDPVAKIVQGATSALDARGLLPPQGSLLRTIGGFAIPQNTTEAALFALMAAQPETAAARYGVPLLKGLAEKGLAAGAKRALARGAVTAGVGAATGRDPLQSGEAGVAGSVLGDVAGKWLKSEMQREVSNPMLGQVTQDFADSVRKTMGQWLPAGKEGRPLSAERILRAVGGDELKDKIGAEINAKKAALGDKPVSVIDLEPMMTEAGVVYAKPVPGAPGAEVTHQWPPVRRFESKLTPGREIARSEGVIRREEPLRDVLARIETARAETYNDIKRFRETDPPMAARAGERFAKQEELETLVAGRADPALGHLFRQYGRAKQLTEMMRAGSTDAAKWSDGMFDREGKLTWEGYQRIALRIGLNQPGLNPRMWEPWELDLYHQSVRIDPEGGMVTGGPSEGPIKNIGIGLGGRPHGKLQVPRAAFMPGWEQEAGKWRASIAPGAVRAITGQAPLHLQSDRRDE